MKIEGVWLPVITPFIDGAVDYGSYESLINHYLQKGIHGLVPLGTTGESPAIEEDEFITIVEATIRIVNGRVPVYFGVGGDCTKKVIARIKQIGKLTFDGILSASPYYNRRARMVFTHISRR